MDKQAFRPASGQPNPTVSAADTPEIVAKCQKNEDSGGPTLRAEIIAIGDELSSGVRLDTNSQWISQSLDRLGIQTAFHSTVGDDLGDMLAAFEIAAGRVDLIFTTGGLGPTADDLTRYIIAKLADVELALDESVLRHIKSMYQSRGREMPPNNEVQAWFPEGAIVIDNPEGTAPGIEFAGFFSISEQNPYRIFSFPGVPAELKQMWQASVQQRLIELYAIDATIFHHTIHCFGTGESAIEMQLPDLIRRGRDPLVGITASAATISLRIATRGANREECFKKMQPTIEIIRDRLGDLVYGENGQQLEEVVASELSANQQTIGVFDWGLGGDVARRLAAATPAGGCLRASRAYSQCPDKDDVAIADRLKQILQDESWHEGANVVLLIGPVDRDEATVASGESYYDVAIGWSDQNGGKVDGGKVVSQQFRYSGHSAWREIRAVKDVLNFLRLQLLVAQK